MIEFFRVQVRVRSPGIYKLIWKEKLPTFASMSFQKLFVRETKRQEIADVKKSEFVCFQTQV